MDEITLFSLILGFFLRLIHFFSDKIKPSEETKHYRIISFAAGISIAYLFLDLLPQTYQGAIHLKEWVFVFLLLGFSLFHLIEKFTYQHADQEKLARELKEFHSISFFIYYFLIGIVLKDKLHENFLEGILFLIPIALHAGLSTASLARIHGEVRESLWAKSTLSLSTLLGVTFSIIVSVPAVVDNIFLSLIAGVLLYIIGREFLPQKEKGQPQFFILGNLLFLAIMILITILRN
jgi:zinc transporter ZupT